MQIRAIVGQIGLAGIALAAIAQALGHDTTAEAIKNCTNNLGPDALEHCKQAAQGIGVIGKEVYVAAGSGLAWVFGQLNFFANAKGKPDPAALKELEKKSSK